MYLGGPPIIYVYWGLDHISWGLAMLWVLQYEIGLGIICGFVGCVRGISGIPVVEVTWGVCYVYLCLSLYDGFVF